MGLNITKEQGDILALFPNLNTTVWKDGQLCVIIGVNTQEVQLKVLDGDGFRAIGCIFWTDCFLIDPVQETPNISIHYFSIIQALIRTAVCMVPKGEKPTDAFTHQVERLKKALKADGLNDASISVEEILNASSDEIEKFKIVRSSR